MTDNAPKFCGTIVLDSSFFIRFGFEVPGEYLTRPDIHYDPPMLSIVPMLARVGCTNITSRMALYEFTRTLDGISLNDYFKHFSKDKAYSDLHSKQRKLFRLIKKWEGDSNIVIQDPSDATTDHAQFLTTLRGVIGQHKDRRYASHGKGDGIPDHILDVRRGVAIAEIANKYIAQGYGKQAGVEIIERLLSSGEKTDPIFVFASDTRAFQVLHQKHGQQLIVVNANRLLVACLDEGILPLLGIKPEKADEFLRYAFRQTNPHNNIDQKYIDHERGVNNRFLPHLLAMLQAVQRNEIAQTESARIQTSAAGAEMTVRNEQPPTKKGHNGRKSGMDRFNGLHIKPRGSILTRE